MRSRTGAETKREDAENLESVLRVLAAFPCTPCVERPLVSLPLPPANEFRATARPSFRDP